jgi:NitT/TauT family transport system permease protein
MRTVRHYHHHFHFSYLTSPKRHFTSTLVVLFLLIFLFLLFIHFVTPQNGLNLDQISFPQILLASIFTLSRLFIAYILGLILSVPLALLITSTPKVEKFLLPVFDIIQSIPVLAFFPVIVVTFVHAQFLEGAALFILVVDIMGSLVFSMIGGLKTIPEDIQNAAIVFKATGWNKLWKITLPSIFPYIMTGSLLAWSEGWSIIIVAEALHTYIPGGTSSQDLFGLGSLLVDAFASGKNSIFLLSLITMVVIISLLNYFVWQKLLHFAERFRFD